MSPKITITPIGKERFTVQEVVLSEEAVSEASIGVGCRPVTAVTLDHKNLSSEVEKELLKLARALIKTQNQG